MKMSKVVNEMLQEASGLAEKDNRFRNLDAFSGVLSAREAAEFERTQVDFDHVDEDAWA